MATTHPTELTRTIPDQSERLLVADVGIDSRSAGSEAVYTYRAGEGVKLGQARFVPLGPRRVLGFVMALREVGPEDLGFDPALLKDLGDRVHGADLPPAIVALAHEVSRQTLAPLAMAVTLVSPPGVRERVVTKWRATGAAYEGDLTTAQREALRVLGEQEIEDTKSKPVPRGVKSALGALERRGLAVRALTVVPFTERNSPGGLMRLTRDEKKVEAFLTGQGLKRPAQLVTVMRLQGSEAASFTVQEIKALGGVSDSTVKSLVGQGLLERVEDGDAARADPPVPNADQARAIARIVEAVKSGKGGRFLLYGVTGSGKTEVYLRAAAEALKWGRQVLYLVPEIALTAQVIAQLRARFGRSVAVMHSNMSPGERLDNWMAVHRGEAPIVLGARSALFAPLSNLGLIVMDEEHEASYKQENAPRYHSRRLAAFLAAQSGAPLVMGSATPSVETFYEASEGRVERLDLPSRTLQARLPEVHVEDMTEMYKEGRPSIFSARLEALMNETLARGEQAILFLNRRAYSPFILCRECGHRFLCPHCSVSLAFHRRDHKLRCHHCGHQEAAPDTCPDCGGSKVSGFGVGAEKVEEAVAVEFPGARVARLDRDTTRRKGALEETFAKFRAGETNVLVGTQMVAKGLDFPNVTLVGVVAADVSLNVPDFRASERTFQLLSQVAGRAGRSVRPGEVVIQTFCPGHLAVQCAQRHDYESLFAAMVTERREAQYPPFVRIVNVLVLGDVFAEVVAVSASVGERLRSALPGAAVLGPTSCPIERRNKMWRRHVLVKLPPDGDPAPIAAAIAGLGSARTRVWIDVDAYNLA
ncbi:MAG: primosomal protein N' [Fimbriimonadaceae bacterium]